MDCLIYRDGVPKPVEGDLDAMLAALTGVGEGEFGWLALARPEADVLSRVAGALHLPPLAVEDASEAHQRAKVDRYDEQVFVVLKTLSYDDKTSSIETGEVDIFALAQAVVTVSHCPTDDPIADARRRLESDPTMLQHGAEAVVYTIADVVVDSYSAITAEVQTDITQLEMAVFAPGRKDMTEQIYGLKREVLEFREAVDPLWPVAQAIQHGRSPLPGGDNPKYRDVADHLLQVHSAVRGFDDLINSILSAHLARSGMWQNEDMRKISAYAALIAVPTLIAGIYGMNFAHMPELHWMLGYPLSLALMVVLSGTLYRVFRRNGWL
jgi:magnesium transporter